MTSYIGCRPPRRQCPCLIDEEDTNRTTIYKACSCNGANCNLYQNCYCPIR